MASFYLFMKQSTPRSMLPENIGCGDCLMLLNATTKADALVEVTAILEDHDPKYVLAETMLLEFSEDLSATNLALRAARVLAEKEATYARLKAELGK